MADFKTHVTFSSVLGCGYSVAGMMAGVSPSTALVAGGLCGVSGMLPDVDSDSGVPRREAMGFAAAIVPMLLLDRLEQMQLRHDQMVLTAALLYFGIRFVAARLIGKWSVHRGMWHSIPAVLIFAGVAFLITGSTDLSVRYFKAFAVALGAMSHLVLDEVYSVDTRGVVPKFKKSFGTAVKLWSKNGWANFSTYTKLAVVTAMIVA
ncbi:MAG: metal-dependent hydrolase, partial [Planctomycetota bacterium]